MNIAVTGNFHAQPTQDTVVDRWKIPLRGANVGDYTHPPPDRKPDRPDRKALLFYNYNGVTTWSHLQARTFIPGYRQLQLNVPYANKTIQSKMLIRRPAAKPQAITAYSLNTKMVYLGETPND